MLSAPLATIKKNYESSAFNDQNEAEHFNLNNVYNEKIRIDIMMKDCEIVRD